MGQKVHPVCMRIGVNRSWDSRWISDTDYSTLLHEDIRIRNYIMTTLAAADVAKVVIERLEKKVCVFIHSARPGVLIGKKGAEIDKLSTVLKRMSQSDVAVNVVEVRKPELDAKLVADGIARQLERRVSFRRAMKRAMQSAMKLGALGVRINCSGRLGGAEIARVEWFREGRVPLHTLKSLVDFGVGVAKTMYGTCGVKVWVYTGDRKGVG